MGKKYKLYCEQIFYSHFLKEKVSFYGPNKRVRKKKIFKINKRDVLNKNVMDGKTSHS